MGINTRSGMTLKILVENSPLEYKWEAGRVYNVTPRKVKLFIDNSFPVHWNKYKKTIRKIVHENVRELLRDEIKALTEALDKDCIPDESCMRRVEFTLKEGEKEVTVEKYIDVNSVLIYKKPTEYIMDEYIKTYYLEYDQDIACMLTELFNIFEEKNKEELNNGK